MSKHKNQKYGRWDSTPGQRTSFYREFGLVMKIMRNRQNISISDIANRLRLKEEVVRGYESGMPIPFIDLLAIYDYLRIFNRP